MATVDLNEANFDDLTEAHELILLDFWAAWCGPCQVFAPHFEAASERHPDILFGKIDTETETRLARQFEILSIPTLLAVKQGTIFFARPGALGPDKLETLIQDLRRFQPEGE